MSFNGENGRGMSIVQSQTQKQVQKLTSQQIQLHNILALPTVALEQYIANEMAINPALEYENAVTEEPQQEEQEEKPEYQDVEELAPLKIEDVIDHTEYLSKDTLDDYKYEAHNFTADEDKREQVYLETPEFTALLIEQLNLLMIPDEDKQLGAYLINSLDNDGYLRRDLGTVADELSFSLNTAIEEERLEEVLRIIQSLEPVGIGARNLRECLLLQLRHKPLKTRETYNAIVIVDKYMEELSSRRTEHIRAGVGINEEELQEALTEIRKMNPAPAGSSFENTKTAVTIEPDFTVTVSDGQVELFLNSSKQPPLKISDDYVDMLEGYAHSKDKKMKEAAGFIKSKIESARWFIEALQLREKTMIMVTRAIVKHQQRFFLTGDEAQLRPLILKTIAEEINSDISTVSRIASSKYIQTEYGIILIKDLFVEGLSTITGETVSTNEVKLNLADCVKSEDKRNPLSDEEIAKLLLARNYSIARRTVAKYRDELKIPSRNLRRVAMA